MTSPKPSRKKLDGERRKNMKKLKRESSLLFDEPSDYGLVGEETPIVDKNGQKLKVGDLVDFELIISKTSTCYGQTVIVYNRGKYFAMGLFDSFDYGGTYDNLTIKKVKNCEDIPVDGSIFFGSGYITYVDEEEE